MATHGLNSDVVVPGLVNGWGAAGGGNMTPGYYKDPTGHVHLRGLITGGAGAAAFTLPIGFRPSLQMTFLVSSIGGSSTVTITAGGVVTPSTNACYLEGVAPFLAEN